VFRLVRTRLESFLDEDIEGGRFMLAVLVYNKVVEDVVEEGLHDINFASTSKVTPGLHKGVLYKILALGMVMHPGKGIAN